MKWYSGISGLFEFDVNFVSCIAAMWIFFFLRKCPNSSTLFRNPFIFSWRMLIFSFVVWFWCCGGLFGRGGEEGGGGGGEGWEGVVLVGEVLQHGPIHVWRSLLSLADFRPEHFKCIHSSQLEHCREVWFLYICLWQWRQNHFGPGFVSIPARISNSLRRHAGNVFTIVGLIKNNLLKSNLRCQI